MKPTKRKLLNEINLDLRQFFNHANKSSSEDIDFSEYDQVIIPTAGGSSIMGFLYSNNGNPVAIPEPDPTILYLINAEREISSILENKERLNRAFLADKSAKTANIFFDFFQHSTNFIVNLYTSIEAFHNSSIPDQFIYEKRNESLDKMKIQFGVNFKDKCNKLLPLIYRKSFTVDFNTDYLELLKLKRLRDSMVHTKNVSNTSESISYRAIFRDSLDFDYENTLLIVKKYFNYYKKDYVDNC